MAAAALQGQTYWSTDSSLDCTGVAGPAAITIPGGGTGYVCYVGGPFEWYAAGGSGTQTWKTFIRTGAPTTAPVNVDYTFYDTSGNSVSLDTTSGTSATVTSGSEVNFTLNTNQPSQINLLGLGGTSHSTTAEGTVYALFQCPDPTTCESLAPQLFYSILPSLPWFLSVPLTYDQNAWTQWSGVGIDDGGGNRVSLAVSNDDWSLTTPTQFTISVYDSNGNLAGTGMTPPINPVPVDGSGNPSGEGGTWADLLSNVVHPLPSGPFKVLIDGGTIYSVAEMLQITGSTAAATLQLAYDNPSDQVSGVSAGLKANAKTARMSAVNARLAAHLKALGVRPLR